MRDFKGVLYAVGGGKRGVGKTLVAVNTACALALDGYEVLHVDADLAVEGMPNAMVRDKVRWQHRGIVSGVRAGRIDQKIAGIQRSTWGGRVG